MLYTALYYLTSKRTTTMRIVYLLLLLCLSCVAARAQSATASLQNPQVLGNELTVDLYIKNTGSTPIRLVDCSLYLRLNESKFTSLSATFTTSLTADYSANVSTYNTSPKTLSIELFFGPRPSSANTIQLSSTGNGTKIGTLTISGISTFTGLAELAWATVYPSLMFRWDPQTGNIVAITNTAYATPPDIYLGPVYDVVLRNQSINDQQYTFDVYLKRTGGQPFYLGNSTLKIGLNTTKFSSPTAVVIARGTSRLADYYTYATQVQGTTLTLTVTAPVTATQANFDSQIQTISNTGTGTHLATVAVSGLSNPVSILDIAPSWQTTATVLRTRRAVSNWTVADDITANASFQIETPSVALALISPNGGQALCPGTVHTVQWSSNNLQRIKLELVPEAGLPVTIATSLSATSGSYLWTVPALSGTYRMKISDPARPALSDLSDNTFVIQTAAALTSQPVSQTVCEGANAAFVSGGTGTPVIQWQVSTDGQSWQNIAGATSATLALSTVTASMSGNRYRVKYTSACSGELISTAALLTVNTAPRFTTQLQPQTVCSGESAVFTVQIAGTPAPAIQWQVSTDGGTSWTPLSGATTSTLTIANTQVSMDGALYRAVLSNTCGQNILSNNALLTVRAAPAITQHPQSTATCSGADVVFTATANGSPAPAVEWQSSTDGTNWTVVAGGSGTTLTLTGVTQAMNGRMYRAVFSNVCRAIASNPATLTVGTAVQLTAALQNMVVCEGTTATALLSPIGSPEPTVVWQQSTDGANWTVVSGQNTVLLTLPSVTASMNGRMYRAVLSNMCTPALTSNTITLTVNTAPQITAQPVEVVICTGETVSYRVDIAGSPVPAVQWQVRTSNTAAWQTMPGKTGSELQLSSVQPQQNGSLYRAVVSNSCGSTVSNEAALWLLSKPSVSVQPQDITVCEGAPVLLQVGASGLPQPTVQWQVSLTGGASWNDMPQATSAVVSIASADRSLDNTLYRAVVQNTCGSVVSAVAKLSVHTRPEFVEQALSTTACAGQAAVFTAAADGNPVPEVRWQSSFDAGATWVDIGGATGTVLELSNVRSTQDQTLYRPVFRNSCGEAVGSAAVLTVLTAPRISVQPVSKTLVVEETVQFSAAVEVVGAVSYQWYKGVTALQDGGRFSGAKTPQLTITSVQPTDVDNAYYVVVTGVCGADTSDFAALNINVPGIAIAAQPKPVAACQGGTVEFSITASTDVQGASLWYQWRRGNTVLADGGKYSGVNTPTLRIAGVAAEDASTNYNVQITVQPGGATTYSNNATLRVDVLPSISASPVSVAVCEGSPAVVEVAASGSGPLQYRWLHNGSEVPQATEPRYIIPVVGAQSVGLYECVVSNGCGSAVSEKATVSMQRATEITTEPTDIAGTLGRDYTLEVAAVGTGALSYQWYRNTEPIAGATQRRYTIVSLSDASTGGYTCVVRGDCGADTSSQAIVGITVAVDSPGNTEMLLGQNFPNPFGARTTIPVRLAHGGSVELVVRDVFGRELLVLHRGWLAAGHYSFSVEPGALPANGVYFYTLTAEGRTTTRAMLMQQ